MSVMIELLSGLTGAAAVVPVVWRVARRRPVPPVVGDHYMIVPAPSPVVEAAARPVADPRIGGIGGGKSTLPAPVAGPVVTASRLAPTPLSEPAPAPAVAARVDVDEPTVPVAERVVPSEAVASTVTPGLRDGDLVEPALAIVAAADSQRAAIAGLRALGAEHGLAMDYLNAWLIEKVLREKLASRAAGGAVTS
jgi:hypothetical protein